jgi:hypothetical protein
MMLAPMMIAAGSERVGVRNARYRRQFGFSGASFLGCSNPSSSAKIAKDFENLAETLATFVTLASIQLALRRLATA